MWPGSAEAGEVRPGRAHSRPIGSVFSGPGRVLGQTTICNGMNDREHLIINILVDVYGLNRG